MISTPVTVAMTSLATSSSSFNCRSGRIQFSDRRICRPFWIEVVKLTIGQFTDWSRDSFEALVRTYHEFKFLSLM